MTGQALAHVALHNELKALATAPNNPNRLNFDKKESIVLFNLGIIDVPNDGIAAKVGNSNGSSA